MKSLVFHIFLLAALVGCAPNVQVVTLRGSNVQPDNEGLVLDTDTLTLRYNFASERGLMHLSLVNKLDKPLYIDWKRSSFIIGQNKVDYWYDVVDVHLVGRSTNYSRYSTTTSLNGTFAKPEQISFVPPQTKLEKQQFIVVPSGQLTLGGTPTTIQERAKGEDRKKPIDINVFKYASGQSPLTFRNYLTLSTDKDFKTEFSIDTKFWASDVKVLPRDHLLTQRTSKGYEYNYVEVVPFKQPDGFYIIIPKQ
ncbi:hypothetical protein [Spirosoma aerophilum]